MTKVRGSPPAAEPRKRKVRRSGAVLFALFTLALVVAVVLALRYGAEALSWQDFRAALEGTSVEFRNIVFELRLPRVALLAVSGACLATAGAAYQGLFRNPLADPYIIGVAAGAGLGATCALAFGVQKAAKLFVVPASAFVGGTGAVVLALLIARVGRRTPVTTMLLAGVAIASLATALQTLVLILSGTSVSSAFVWILGGTTAGMAWEPVWIVLGCLVPGILILRIAAPSLNALQLDEEAARQLGVRVGFVTVWVLAAATLMTGAAVAFGGLVGFVGLIVPHIARLLGGPDHRRLVLLSPLGGGALLVLADLVGRVAPMATDKLLPVGAVTPLLGVPFFLFLLRRIKRSVF